VIGQQYGVPPGGARRLSCPRRPATRSSGLGGDECREGEEGVEGAGLSAAHVFRFERVGQSLADHALGHQEVGRHADPDQAPALR